MPRNTRPPCGGISGRHQAEYAHQKRDGAIKNRKLLRQVQALDKLSKRDQQALLRTIDLFLSKAVST